MTAPTIAEGIIAVVCGWVNDGQDPASYAGLRAQIDAVLELRVRRPAHLTITGEGVGIAMNNFERAIRIDECERALALWMDTECDMAHNYMQHRLAELRAEDPKEEA